MLQSVTAFIIGLILGSTSPSLGWVIIYTIIYELSLWIIKGRNTKGVTRLAVNCATLLGLVIGDWFITGETLFDAFLYNIPTQHDVSYGVKLLEPIIDQLDSWTRS